MRSNIHNKINTLPCLAQVFQEGLVWAADSSAADSLLVNSGLANSGLANSGLANSGLANSGLANSGVPPLHAAKAFGLGGSLQFGIPEIDSLLPQGGLARGALHELVLIHKSDQDEAIFGEAGKGKGRNPYPSSKPSFFPRMLPALLAYSSWKNVAQQELPYLVWIGKNSWPTRFALEQLTTTLPFPRHVIFDHCLFIDPPTRQLHLWALELALKTKGVGVVIADCSNIALAKEGAQGRNQWGRQNRRTDKLPLAISRGSTSRRLSLAARANNTTALLLSWAEEPRRQSRADSLVSSGDFSSGSAPPGSTSHSRWALRPLLSESLNQCWQIELLRVKGSGLNNRTWQIEMLEEQAYETTLSLRLLPSLVNQSPPNNTALERAPAIWQQQG